VLKWLTVLQSQVDHLAVLKEDKVKETRPTGTRCAWICDNGRRCNKYNRNSDFCHNHVNRDKRQLGVAQRANAPQEIYSNVNATSEHVEFENWVEFVDPSVFIHHEL